MDKKTLKIIKQIAGRYQATVRTTDNMVWLNGSRCPIVHIRQRSSGDYSEYGVLTSKRFGRLQVELVRVHCPKGYGYQGYSPTAYTHTMRKRWFNLVQAEFVEMYNGRSGHNHCGPFRHSIKPTAERFKPEHRDDPFANFDRSTARVIEAQ